MDILTLDIAAVARLAALESFLLELVEVELAVALEMKLLSCVSHHYVVVNKVCGGRRR